MNEQSMFYSLLNSRLLDENDLPCIYGNYSIKVLANITCASSASLERVFSSFGLVHTKLRNKLGIAKAQKLVYCYRMLRGSAELDY